MNGVRHFGRDSVHALDPTVVAGAMADALAAVSSGRAVAPVRAHLDLGGGAGTYLIYGVLPDLDLLSVKVINVRPGNVSRGLERLQGSLTVFEASTGLPLATIDARAATEVRTAACSAVSVRLLARAGARVLTVFGTGPQASAHVRALKHERAFEEVRVVGHSPQAATAFVAAHPGTVAGDPQTATAGADVVVTATNSTSPVIGADRISPGTHVVMVGSGSRAACEAAPELLGRAAAIRVDHRESCLEESGEIVAALAANLIRASDVHELGEVVLGTAPGRTSPVEITVYKSVGNGTQDAALAGLLLGRTVAR